MSNTREIRNRRSQRTNLQSQTITTDAATASIASASTSTSPTTYLIEVPTIDEPTETDEIATKLQRIETKYNTYIRENVCMPIRELIQSSKETRAKGVPRPMNKFFLFRKNYSTREKQQKQQLSSASIIDISVTRVSKGSKNAWEKMKQDNDEIAISFWIELAQLAKMSHTANNCGYKYKPNKSINSSKSNAEGKKRERSDDEQEISQVDITSGYNSQEELLLVSPTKEINYIQNIMKAKGLNFLGSNQSQTNAQTRELKRRKKTDLGSYSTQKSPNKSQIPQNNQSESSNSNSNYQLKDLDEEYIRVESSDSPVNYSNLSEMNYLARRHNIQQYNNSMETKRVSGITSAIESTSTPADNEVIYNIPLQQYAATAAAFVYPVNSQQISHFQSTNLSTAASQAAIDPRLLFLTSQPLSPRVIYTPNFQTHLFAPLTLAQHSSILPATIQNVTTAEVTPVTNSEQQQQLLQVQALTGQPQLYVVQGQTNSVENVSTASQSPQQSRRVKSINLTIDSSRAQSLIDNQQLNESSQSLNIQETDIPKLILNDDNSI
ncbi:3852_t:CDS:2 [Ambispora gerdemannii]|uniref:3852_t:CDS:1 n=1 Tax=Ambispora gerdemannii TaxID=144530 RepID=A0A9N8Z7Y5_9GLOM|nr:3852_t:CDS:2 [Ambispora gerdemannii]